VKRDPRVDAYIARAQPFAQPILAKVRERVHAVVPDVDEAMKWSRPAFCRKGRIILGAAAFKQHATVHFWRSQELGFGATGGASGPLARLTDVSDLPPDLDQMIARAAELCEQPPSVKPRQARSLPAIHPEFAAALDREPGARSVFDAFPPGQQREYLDWVAEAKQESTRDRRIATAVEWLREGKRRNWKYENC
jgi:uncharacterized protein YdeI (YjbR/CyaY-like superfamily)